MAMTIHVDIVSAEEEIFSGPAEMVFAPAEMGEVGISPRHTPLLTRLKPGEVRVQVPNEQEERFYYVSGGMLEVQPHVVTVLADTALRAKDLDEAAALEAKQKAEDALADKRAEFEYAEAQAELAQAVAQLRAIEKLRKKSGRS
jgi:F-type H+-transporting ATPase subunit epsilon